MFNSIFLKMIYAAGAGLSSVVVDNGSLIEMGTDIEMARAASRLTQQGYKVEKNSNGDMLISWEDML